MVYACYVILIRLIMKIAYDILGTRFLQLLRILLRIHNSIVK